MTYTRTLKLLAAVLLVLIPAPALWAGTKTMTAIGTSAIDTLTVFGVSGGDGTIAAATVTRADSVLVKTGMSAAQVLDSLVADSANFFPFRIVEIAPDTVRFLPPDGGNVASLKIAGTELTGSKTVAGITYTLVKEDVPGLGWYAFGILALLMVVSAWWFMRQRPVTVK